MTDTRNSGEVRWVNVWIGRITGKTINSDFFETKEDCIAWADYLSKKIGAKLNSRLKVTFK